MAKTVTEADARTHLEKLAAALQRRGYEATVTNDERDMGLKVVNPKASILNERIVCRRTPYGWSFRWSWREEIGTAEEVGKVADRIVHVLRG